MMELFQRAWGIVQRDLIAWVMYFGVWLAVTMMSAGLGIIFTISVLRGMGAAIREQRAPQLGDAFKLDTLGDDLPALGIFYAGVALCSAAGGVGAYLAPVLVGWVPYLATERRYQPIELWKVTTKSAAEDWQTVLIFSLITSGITIASLCLFGLPFLVALPVCAVANWLLYEEHRERLFAIADQEAIPLLSGGDAAP